METKEIPLVEVTGESPLETFVIPLEERIGEIMEPMIPGEIPD